MRPSRHSVAVDDRDNNDNNHDQSDHAEETRPLLTPPAAEPRHEAIYHHHPTRCSWPWLRIVAFALAIAVVCDVGESLYVAPRIRLFESVVCRDYFLRHNPSLVDRDGGVPEHWCKVDAVQAKVASILGWQFFFDSIPAILLPIPFGYVADKHGRKWVLTLAMFGYFLSYVWTLLAVGPLHLPLQYVWLSSLFFLICGGPTTATTLLTTVVADVVPPQIRGTVFFYRFCTDLVADLLIPPLTSHLMSIDVWIPLLGAVISVGLTTVMLLAFPETLPIPALPQQQPTGAANTSGEEGGGKPSWFTAKGRTLGIRVLKENFGFVTSHAALGSLVLTFLISKVGRQSTNILFQYVSKRYEWTLAQAGLLISLRAAVNIAMFAAILPALTTFVLTRWPPVSRDLLLAKGSIVLLALGTFTVFLSSTPAIMILGVIVFTLGSGFPPAARSLATFLVETHEDSSASDIGRLYAMISTMEGIGSLVAAPGMAWTFRLGMSWGKAWYGLPFGLATALFGLVSIIVVRIRMNDVK